MKIIILYIKQSLITLTFLIQGYSFCQKDTNDIDFQKQFDDFNKSITKEFYDFKSKNDSIFLKFLDDSWREFKMFRNDRSVVPKPEKQPVAEEKIDQGFKILPRKNDKLIYNNGNEPEYNFEIIDKINLNEFDCTKQFDYYGSNLNSYYSKKDLPQVDEISKEAVSQFFRRAMSSNKLNGTIQLLKQTADSLKQNDWGYILLLKSAAREIFESLNDQKLFIWYALLKNYNDVKSGLDKNRFYLLVNTSHEVYNTSYFILNNKKYYLIAFEDDPDEIAILISHEAEYPNATNQISLFLKVTPLFMPNNITRSFIFRDDTFNIQINKNLIDYYNDYPDADLNLYFSTPVSNSILYKLHEFFNDLFIGKNQVQIIDILLEFIQLSIAYKNDIDQFGYEKYLFAEETLYYPYADCEDRAVLLARLVIYFTDLSTVGLSYPTHISLAVAFNEKIQGDYLFYNDKEYYICDPTYIGAKSGNGMEDLRNVQPIIIDYE